MLSSKLRIFRELKYLLHVYGATWTMQTTYQKELVIVMI